MPEPRQLAQTATTARFTAARRSTGSTRTRGPTRSASSTPRPTRSRQRLDGQGDVPLTAEQPGWGSRMVKGAWWRWTINVRVFEDLHNQLTG